MRQVGLFSLVCALLITSPVFASIYRHAPFEEGRYPPFDCYWENDDPEGGPPGDPEFIKVDPGDLENTVFSANFDLYVCWDYRSGDPIWNVDSLRGFADLIVDSVAGDERGLAKTILDYFGEDTDPSSTSLAITKAGSEQDTTLYFFEIYLSDIEQYCHGCENWVAIHIRDTDTGSGLPVAAVAGDGFAHEWQHVCYQTWNRISTMIRPFSIFNEMCAVFSVFANGREILGHSDNPYDFSVMPNYPKDFHKQCMKAHCVYFDGAVHDTCSSYSVFHYNDWAMMAAYLNENYSIGNDVEGELMYRWIRQSVLKGDILWYEHDFVGLAKTLDHEDLDYLFPVGMTAHEKLTEVFRRYGVAKFLNLQTDPGWNSHLMYRWADGKTPQDYYGFMVDRDGECCSNIQVFPVYHVCEESDNEVSSWVTSESVWGSECQPPEDWCTPQWLIQRMVEVQTYASNYLVFLPESGEEGYLSVRIDFPDQYECMECDSENGFAISIKDNEYADYNRIAADVITYSGLDPSILEPGGENALDRLGGYATGIETHWIDPAALGYLSLSVDSFGDEVDAVAIVLSAVPEYAQEYNVRVFPVPYRYRYAMIPEGITFLSGEIYDPNLVLPSNSRHWILGELRVTSIGGLTIQDGVQLFFCGEDSKLVVDGGTLTVNGTAENPVEMFPSNLPQYSNEKFAGIYLEDGGQISGSNCHVFGTLEFSDEESDLDLDYWDVHFADDSENAIVIDTGPDADCFLDHVDVANANILRLNGNCTLTNCNIAQRRDYFPLISPYPLVEIREGIIDIANSTLQFVEKGIKCGVFTSDTPVLNMGPMAWLEPFTQGSKRSVGIECRGYSSAYFDDIEIEKVSYCLLMRDNSSLDMKRSKLLIDKYGMVAYGGTRPLILGVASDPEHYPGENLITFYPEGDTDCSGVWSRGQCSEELQAHNVTRILNWSADTIYAQNNKWGSCELTTVGTQWADIDCICPAQTFRPDTNTIKYKPNIKQAYSACDSSSHPLSMVVWNSPSHEPSEGVWPNPFNGTVDFVSMADESDVRLEVFDVQGRLVQSLTGREIHGGYLHYNWDGRNQQGMSVSSGVYFYRLEKGREPFQGKVVYVK